MKIFRAKTRKRSHVLRSRRQNERRVDRRFVIKVLSGVGVLVLVIAAIFLVRSPLFRIKNVEIAGTTSLSEESLTKKAESLLAGSYAFLLPKNSSLLAPKEVIVRNLKKDYAQIKSIDLEVENHTLMLSIEDREASSLWCAYSEEGAVPPCMFMDEHMYAFSEAPLFSSSPFPVYAKEGVTPVLRKKLFKKAEVESLEEFQTTLKKLKVEPEEVISRTDGSIDVRLGESATPLANTTLVVNSDEDLRKIPMRAEILLEEGVLENVLKKEGGEKFEYVDMRFGNKIFYKVKSNEAPPEEPIVEDTEVAKKIIEEETVEPDVE